MFIFERIYLIIYIDIIKRIIGLLYKTKTYYPTLLSLNGRQ